MRIGWLSTGRGVGSLGLLRAAEHARRNSRNLELAFIACTREKGEADGSDNFIRSAENLGTPVVTLSWRKFKQQHPELKGTALRAAYDEALYERIKGHPADAAVMAGYMLVSHSLHRRIPCINLHPALPDGPSGTWKQVLEQLIEEGAEYSGVTIHKVSDDLDAGPPLTYCRYPIREEMTESTIRQFGLQYESILMADTLVELAEGRVNLDTPGPALDLTNQVSHRLAP